MSEDAAMSEAACAALDKDDPLAYVRDRFEMPGDELVYLDGQ